MTRKYYSRRTTRRLAQKSKRNFIITLVIVGVLLYSTITWVLPTFIGSIAFVKNITNPPKETSQPVSENSNLAPPVLNIPYEATNTAQINIGGYGTADSKVRLYIDDKQISETKISEDGSFAFENVDLAIGTNNIYGITLDSNNKESLPSKTIKLYYSSEKPSLSISEPEDNKTIQGGDKKVKVAGKTDPDVKVFINGTQVIVNGDGNFSTEIPLNEGDNQLTISAQDRAMSKTEQQRKVIFQP